MRNTTSENVIRVRTYDKKFILCRKIIHTKKKYIKNKI